MKIRGLLAGAMLTAAIAFGQNAETATFTYSGPPVAILYSSDGAQVADILVSRALRVQRVSVRLQVDYPSVGDLNVFLYSAQGTRTRLLQRNCANLQNIDTTFEDAAPTRYSSFCPAEPGRGPFQGNEPLANSNNESSLGVWRLAIQNNGSDVRGGFLRAFSITITGTPITRPTFTADTVVSDASGLGGSIAPGDRIRIYGSGLGPATPASAPAGDAPPTLSGTTVVIDNIRAAVLYASATMAIVQVPYGEIPGTAALIQVGYNDQTSDVIALPVRRARPAIYTVGADNRQAKAFSEYGQLNSRENAAPKGGTLVFYASGLGITDPLLSSGLSTPNNQLFYALYPIGVYIGDVQVPVSFAGLAPGLNGIYQINVQVPDGVNSGQQDLVIVTSNGAVSQSNVTVWIQ